LGTADRKETKSMAAERKDTTSIFAQRKTRGETRQILGLNRETIRDLTAEEAVAVQGGEGTDPCHYSDWEYARK
jgi:hypothetical protein